MTVFKRYNEYWRNTSYKVSVTVRRLTVDILRINWNTNIATGIKKYKDTFFLLIVVFTEKQMYWNFISYKEKIISYYKSAYILEFKTNNFYFLVYLFIWWLVLPKRVELPSLVRKRKKTITLIPSKFLFVMFILPNLNKWQNTEFYIHMHKNI